VQDTICLRAYTHCQIAQTLTSSGSLVYEYIGEVVAEKTFRKRLQQYADEGLRHFYFMMLQKEEVSLFSRSESGHNTDDHSTSMQRKKVELDVSQTTLVTPIVRCRNGLLGVDCEWVFSLSRMSLKERKSPSTTMWIAMGKLLNWLDSS
jgi:hypothetical protein